VQVLVEQDPPQIMQQAAQAQRENEAAIERLKLCMEADTWPSGYAEIRVFDLI
jgi:hypothetical protein